MFEHRHQPGVLFDCGRQSAITILRVPDTLLDDPREPLCGPALA
jgi:hypothetical protein